MKNLILFLLVALFISSNASGQNYEDSITIQIKEVISKSNIPGVGVSIVGIDGSLYSSGFGYADLESKTSFSEETLMPIASISKTLIAVALMQLVEQDKIKLNDPINNYLPFQISNPRYPNEPITIRQLATNTSSLTDGKGDMMIEYAYIFDEHLAVKNKDIPNDYIKYFKRYRTNKPMTMEDFFRAVYLPEGKWCKKSNFAKEPPGSRYRYTNIGAALLAYIIEIVSGESFDLYTTKNILIPLQMNQSLWTSQELGDSKLASKYLRNGFKVPNYRLITYPDGGLITSVKDFNKFLQDMIAGLMGQGKILKQSSYEEMFSNQLIPKHFPNGKFEKPKGLMWTVNKTEDNITMNGSDAGIATFTLFTTEGDLGVVIFNNMTLYDDKDLENDFRAILNILLTYAGKIKKAKEQRNLNSNL